MGMSIDDSIKILQSRKEEALEDGYKGFSNALGNAIDIMRKYQKIQEIITNRESVENENAPQSKHIYMADAYMQIREVIEDRND